MDPIILDFAMGIAIGAMSELLFLRRSVRRVRSQKPVSRTRPAIQPRIVHHSTKTLTVNRATIARPVSETNALPNAQPSLTRSPVAYSEPPQSSCPTCGLRAPEKLMAEHLLGSPLHRQKAPAPLAPPIPRSTSPRKISSSLEEDSRESMRNLLQMLVPPRAFGRRHGQRTANPLEQMIQTHD